MPPCTWMAARALADGGLVGQQLGAADGRARPAGRACTRRLRLGVDDVGRVGQAGRGVHGGPGHLGAHEHVGAHVLDGLEAADGLAELLALLGVGDGQVERRGGVADLQRRGEQRAVARQSGRRRPASGPPAGSASSRHSGVSGSSGRVDAARARRWARAPAAARRGAVGRRGRAARRASPGARPGPGPAARRRATPTCARPSAAPSTDAGTAARGRCRPAVRARAPGPSSSKTTVASARPRPVPAGLGQGEREHAGLAQRGPVAPRRSTRSCALAGPQVLEREPPGHHGPDALGQLALVLADAEVHQRGLGQAEDALGHDVALHLRGAGGDGQRDRLEPVVQLLRVAERARRRARPAGRRTARRGRAPPWPGRRAPARARRRRA